MKLFKNLLVVIAATGVMGSAQAQTPGNIFNLGTLTPTVTATTDAFASGSFLDTFNFTLDATHHIVTGTTDSTNVGNLNFQLLDSGRKALKAEPLLRREELYGHTTGLSTEVAFRL